MSQTTFRKLAHCLREHGELKDQNIMVEESLGIFLFITCHYAKMRTAGHFFQHSLDTIHRHMKHVSRALCTMAKLIIRPTHMEGVHPYVRCNRNYYPWFKVFVFHYFVVIALTHVSYKLDYRQSNILINSVELLSSSLYVGLYRCH